MTPRAAILQLLRQRDAGKTICPSEAARLMDPHDWRNSMKEVREAGNALRSEGSIEVTQSGEPVDPTGTKGPVRYRLLDR